MSPKKANKPAPNKTAREHPGAAVKEGWETKTLAEVTTKIGSGATPRGGDESYKAEGISLIRSLNVYDDGFREGKLARIDDKQAERLSNVVVEAHDVLLNITGASIARCCRAPADFLPARVNQHVAIIRPRKETVDPDYLYYLLTSEVYKNRLLNAGEEGGATRQAITKAQLQEFVIEFPLSLPEQKRIVALLDEAFAGIATAKANAEKNLQNARAVFESHLQSVFTQGGPLVSLSDLADEITDGDHAPPPKAPTGIPFITISDIDKRTGMIDFSNTFMVPEEYFHKLKSNKKPRIGDVLYTVTGATLGIPVLVREQRDFCFQRHIGLIRPNLEVDSSWLTYALRSPQVFHQATSGSTGAAQKTVSLSVLRGLKLPRVSPKEQKLVATKLDTLSAETQRLASIYEKKIAALDELKKALLRQAFSGEL